MNFPFDLYVLQGLVKQFGNKHTLRLLKSSDGISSDMTELLRMFSQQTALVSLSHVTFKSAYMYDMEKVTELAHMHGATGSVGSESFGGCGSRQPEKGQC